MDWTDEAKQAVSRVPFFVRKRVKGYQVETCFGPSGCPNRVVVCESLPAELEKTLSRRKLKDFLKERVQGPLKMHHEFRVSISDCPNACSRPQIVDVGLIGACVPEISEQACSECGACVDSCKENAVILTDGRPSIDASKCLFCGQCIRVCPTGTLKEGEKGYRILIGGKLGRHPRLGEQLPRIYDPDDALRMLDQCLDLYQQCCRSGERFGEILEQEGTDRLKDSLSKDKGSGLVERPLND